MGYYTRVLSKRSDFPTFSELLAAIRTEAPGIELRVDSGEEKDWTALLLVHADGSPIAEIERNVVGADSLASGEVEEFIEEIRDCQPATAVPWLTEFFRATKTIYAFRHLHGARVGRGSEALSAGRNFIWGRGEAILQADQEGFSNEGGYHILWQFAEEVDGEWAMAVLRQGKWVTFQMDLGNPKHRKAFCAGEVPKGIR